MEWLVDNWELIMKVLEIANPIVIVLAVIALIYMYRR